MKCKKFTYVSTLHGSVESDELITNGIGRIDFGCDGVYSLYNRSEEVATWFNELYEELTKYVPEEFKELIVKAIFGKYIVVDGTVQLLTEIHVRQEPTPQQYDKIQEWVIGQLSDGWGEGVEQKEALVETVKVNSTEFDTDTCDFEECSYRIEAKYYIHPWTSKGWCIECTGLEESDIDIPYEEPIVQRSSCHFNAETGLYTTRTMYKFTDSDSAIMFIKNSGASYNEESFRLIEEHGCLHGEVHIFVVHTNEGVVSEFMPIVGLMNKDMARLFKLHEESGEIDMEDFKEMPYREFYEDLMNS